MADNIRNIKELTDIYLNDAAEGEFDSMMAGYRKKRFIGISAALATVLVVMLVLGRNGMVQDSQRFYEDITTLELMKTISAMAEDDLDDIASITAKPGKNGIVVTTCFKTGETRTYLMTRGADGSSIEMTAQNVK